jgi:hypothetical protein
MTTTRVDLHSILSNLEEIRKEELNLDSNFPDLLRLCKRCENFRDYLEGLIEQQREGNQGNLKIAQIYQLSKLFESIISFMKEKAFDSSAKGTPYWRPKLEYVYRLEYVNQLAKLMATLLKLSEEIDLDRFKRESIAPDIRRNEDLEVSLD